MPRDSRAYLCTRHWGFQRMNVDVDVELVYMTGLSTERYRVMGKKMVKPIILGWRKPQPRGRPRPQASQKESSHGSAPYIAVRLQLGTLVRQIHGCKLSYPQQVHPFRTTSPRCCPLSSPISPTRTLSLHPLRSQAERDEITSTTILGPLFAGKGPWEQQHAISLSFVRCVGGAASAHSQSVSVEMMFAGRLISFLSGTRQ